MSNTKLVIICQIIGLILLLVISYGIGARVGELRQNNSIIQPIKDNIIIKTDSAFINMPLTHEALISAFEYYNIKHPDIVHAQAILESGWFTSRLCIEYNNLFGLYNSNIKDYFKFNHWHESVKAYRDKVQYKWDREKDYYQFLIDLPYAEDPNYISKIKSLVNKKGS